MNCSQRDQIANIMLASVYSRTIIAPLIDFRQSSSSHVYVYKVLRIWIIPLYFSTRKNRLLLWHVGILSRRKWPIQCERHRPEFVHAFDVRILWHHRWWNCRIPRSVSWLECRWWPWQHCKSRRTETAEPIFENNGIDRRLQWGLSHIFHGNHSPLFEKK